MRYHPMEFLPLIGCGASCITIGTNPCNSRVVIVGNAVGGQRIVFDDIGIEEVILSLSI